MIQYLHLKPEAELPDISHIRPFKAVVVLDEAVSPAWQAEVSSWLVASGCLYMMAWGKDCSSWDDSVDMANIDAFHFEDIPEDRFVITTWHENEPLSEVFGFAKYSAEHPMVKLFNVVILHVSQVAERQSLLAEYERPS